MKEKAGSVVNGNSNQQPAQTNNSNASNSTTVTTANPNFSYLNNQQAIEKYGTKIYSLPSKDYTVVQSPYTNGFAYQESEGIYCQYWVENNEVKYYFTFGKKIESPNSEISVEPVGIITSEGKQLKGTAHENKLPLSSYDLPPSLKGYGTFEHEHSAKNFMQLTEPTTKYYSVATATGSNYLPSYTVTINNTGKKYGPYPSMMMGMYVIGTSDFFYSTSATQTLPNELYKNGKLIYTYSEPPGGGIAVSACSPNGKLALFSSMDMSKLDAGKPVYINRLSTGATIHFTDHFGDGYALMNSGQMLCKAESSSSFYEEGKNNYIVNGKDKLQLPSASSATFFSDETVYKWALWNEGREFLFSDGTAIAEVKQYGNGANYQDKCLLNPKKITIGSKSYMVWMQVANNNVYLCKKEM